LKNIGIWLVIGLVVLTVVKQFDSRQTSKDTVAYSDFMEQARSGRVESASVEGRTIKWVSTDKKRYVTYSPGDIWMVGDLVKDGVKVEARPEEEQSFLAQIFISWFPMLLLIGVWIFFMRQMQGGGRGGAFSFGKSKARMLDESNNTVTFADVAGCDEAKEDVAELALEFAVAWLEPGGDLAVKMFQGEGFDGFVRAVGTHFAKTYVRKPKASRDRSREVFVVGKGFVGRAGDGARAGTG
jgi:hypothetical protein